MTVRGRPAFLALLVLQFSVLYQIQAAAQNTGSPTWVKIIQETSPAIVVIETETGLGSGFFVNSVGTVVTNYHVIADSKEIAIKLSNGETYHRAYLLSKDETRDIAILRIEASDVPALKLGNSNQAKVGEEVLLIGAPRGLDQTVSNGIISGIRILDDGTRVIQTTAPASPGSSGGPLLDRSGNVIGILTFSVVAGQNLNFAIPVNYAKGMLDTLSLASVVTPLTVLDSTKIEYTSPPVLPPVSPPVSSPSSPVSPPVSPPSLAPSPAVGAKLPAEGYYVNCVGRPQSLAPHIWSRPESLDWVEELDCYESITVITSLGSWTLVRSRSGKEGYLLTDLVGDVSKVRDGHVRCENRAQITVHVMPDSLDFGVAVACNEKVKVIETFGDWVYVQTKDNKEGWMRSMFLGEIR